MLEATKKAGGTVVRSGSSSSETKAKWAASSRRKTFRFDFQQRTVKPKFDEPCLTRLTGSVSEHLVIIFCATFMYTEGQVPAPNNPLFVHYVFQ